MRSWLRPSNRSSRLSLPSRPSKTYSFSISTIGNRGRSAFTASRCRVSSFSFVTSSFRATSHSSRDGRFACRVDQVEPIEQLGGPPFGLRQAQVAQVRHEAEVLLAGEQVVDGGELADDADDVAYGVGFRGEVVPRDAHVTAGGADQRGQDVHHRGLAG